MSGWAWALVGAVVLSLLVVLGGALGYHEARGKPPQLDHRRPCRKPQPTPPRVPPALVLVALVLGCGSPAEDARSVANVVQISGTVAGATLGACTAVLRADAAQVHPAPAGALTMRDEQQRQVVLACDAVDAAYVAIQRSHAALLHAIELAETAERTGAAPNWVEVARLAGEALAAVEAGRVAVTQAQALLAERGGRP